MKVFLRTDGCASKIFRVANYPIVSTNIFFFFFMFFSFTVSSPSLLFLLLSVGIVWFVTLVLLLKCVGKV